MEWIHHRSANTAISLAIPVAVLVAKIAFTGSEVRALRVALAHR
jgi:hypothetical protein